MFIIDVMSRIPVYEQIINQVETNILRGILKPGDKMPSVRSLSVNLSINPNTIQKAYTELDRRKLIVTVPGKGSFIADNAIQIVSDKVKKDSTDMRKKIMELRLAGVTKEELLELVEEVYSIND